MFKKTLNYILNSVKSFTAVKNAKEATLLVSSLVLTSPAYADFQKATTLITNIQSWLRTISVVVITIAILVAGYKIIFQGQTFREVAPILVGGILIGAAAEIAKLFAA
ncbi:hypothetical protein CBE90_04715 [Pasteurella multocida]|uniref:TrbC/VirB2 family protein n=1 Tax=Pasteurella multocida TaxID=747 RepID=UPI000CE78692|nr:TrbC/VirB2 family protein [Pasteurella multocida]PPE94941.1 hypothetical protein CBE90_04715 [Pasteurella multocida]PPE95034.1 hypothetical protein CBE91_10240 [Pasteurella multocida]HDR1236518.1 TrbC/VirB2 family protein [Pasteurella multocida]HDR1501419.1 TrbC/VirB2 family protein [Pasteurella multocida]